MTPNRNPGAARVLDRWKKADGTPSKRDGIGLRWFVRWNDTDGVEREKSFRTKALAIKFREEVTAQLARGEYVSPEHGKTTVKAVYDQWEPTRVRVSEKTKKDYKSSWSKNVEPVWGKKHVGKIRKPDVAAWVADLVEEGKKAATIEKALGVLRQVLGHAVDAGYIRSNPCIGVTAPRRAQQPRHYLTVKQVEALASKVEHGGDVIRLLAFTGLRWTEMASLKVRDVEQGRRRLLVGTERHTKTYKTRSVPYPAYLDDAIEKATVDRRSTEYLFTSIEGKYLDGDNYRKRYFEDALKAVKFDAEEAGTEFPTVTLHDLRHTAASLAIRSGANVKAVQAMLGHKKASMTLDVYADLFPDDLDAVGVAMDALIQADK